MHRTAVEYRPPFFVVGARSDLDDLRPRLEGRDGRAGPTRRPPPVHLRPPPTLRPRGHPDPERCAPLPRPVGGRARGVRPLHALRRRPLPAAALPPRPRPLPVRPGRRARRRDPRDRTGRDRPLHAPAARGRPARGHAGRAAPRAAAARGGTDRLDPPRRRDARGPRGGPLAGARRRARAHRPGRAPHGRRGRARPAVAVPAGRRARPRSAGVRPRTRTGRVPARARRPLVRDLRPDPVPFGHVPAPRPLPPRPGELVPLRRRGPRGTRRRSPALPALALDRRPPVAGHMLHRDGDGGGAAPRAPRPVEEEPPRIVPARRPVGRRRPGRRDLRPARRRLRTGGRVRFREPLSPHHGPEEPLGGDARVPMLPGEPDPRPGLGYRSCTRSVGLIPRTLEPLLTRRIAYKAAAKDLSLPAEERGAPHRTRQDAEVDPRDGVRLPGVPERPVRPDRVPRGDQRLRPRAARRPHPGGRARRLPGRPRDRRFALACPDGPRPSARPERVRPERERAHRTCRSATRDGTAGSSSSPR